MPESPAQSPKRGLRWLHKAKLPGSARSSVFRHPQREKRNKAPTVNTTAAVAALAANHWLALSNTHEVPKRNPITRCMVLWPKDTSKSRIIQYDPKAVRTANDKTVAW